MTVQLSETAVLELAHGDVAAILTENFDSTYGAFAGMAVTFVEASQDGGFRLSFSRIPKEDGAKA
jgi:hypothetical protein